MFINYESEDCSMRVLVYGSGVIGSYLVHVLVRGGNDVTVLARGKRAEELEKEGLFIRHYFQRKTTVDPVSVIKATGIPWTKGCSHSAINFMPHSSLRSWPTTIMALLSPRIWASLI